LFEQENSPTLTRTDLRNVLHPDDQERARMANLLAIATHTDYDIEYRVMRKAAEKMGGRCGVESDGVHGSKFWIELKKPDCLSEGSAPDLDP